MFGGNFAPAGWAFCDGQLLAIAEFPTLFNLIGTTYGGDGLTTFAVPDLQGRVPVHQGSSFSLAQKAGAENVTITAPTLAAHTHTLIAVTALPGSTSPQNALLGDPTANIFNGGTSLTAMGASSITTTGGGQPHDNFQPYLCVTFIISLFGVYPSPT